MATEVTTRPRSRFTRGVATVAFGQLASKALGFFAFAYLARTVGATAYGSIEFAASLATFFSLVIDCGLDAIGVREAARSQDSARQLAGQIPAVRLMIAMAALPAMGLCGFALRQSVETIWLTWLFGLSLIAAPWKQTWIPQSRNAMFAVAAADLLQMTMLYAAVRCLVFSREDLLWLGAAQIASMFAVAVFYLSYQRRMLGPIRFGGSLTALLDLWRRSLPIGMANLLWAMQQYIPVVFMIGIAGAEATGFFGAGHRLIVSLLVFSYIFHFNLFPEMARRAAISVASLADLVQSSFRVVAWASCGLALVISLAARPVLVTLYGEEFQVAALSLSILAWVFPITILGGHARWSLITSGKQQYVFWSQLSGTIVILAAAPILIARFGALGASVSMVLSCLAVWLVAHFYSWRSLGHAPSLWIASRFGLLALILLFLFSSIELSVVARVLISATVFLFCGPFVDARLWSSLRALHAPSGFDRAAI